VIEDGAKLLVLDAKTGEQLARKPLGTMMRSSPLYADGKIYTCTANGRWYILRPTADGVEIVHRLRLPTGEESHGSPIVSHGRIYLPTTGHLYCIGSEQSDSSDNGDASEGGGVTEISRDAPAEHANSIANTSNTGQSKSAEPAHVQVVPCDVLLGPGDTQHFTVRLFDANGEYLTESPAEFSLAGPGTIDKSGTYTAATGNEHTATIVTAKVGELAGTARVRVVPPLPWAFDFNELDDVPLTWIGGRVRYVLRDVDGERIMVKRDSIPTRPGQPPTKLGTRSRLWMGSPELSNYTIQADVMGEKKEGRMPDFGLINQGYTLDLQGARQSLEIRRWAAKEPDITHPTHVPRTIAFPWKPDTWYTLKLTTKDDGQTFRILGKAWPRGTAEPAEWTIEAVDESPQHQGSPGLFGNTPDAEASVDNILVTPN